MNTRPGRGLALVLLALGLEHSVTAAPPALPPTPERGAVSVGDRGRPLAVTAHPVARMPRWIEPSPNHSPDRRDTRRPRAYLIYLVDGGEPIVVPRYVEENGQIVFEKYGGWVRIPAYEILRIVPDVPDPADRTANLPAPAVSPDTGSAPLRPDNDLYVTLRGGNQMHVVSLEPQGERVRVGVSNGSFTVPRSEIVSVVRVPPGSELPEAWLSVLVTDGSEDGAPPGAGLLPSVTHPRLPYQSSDRPHFVRLANGQLMRVEGFWVEDGEFRFQRLGGIIGVALGEVMRLFPDEIAPVRGRTPVRFVRRLAADRLEVGVRSGVHPVRLVGVQPVAGTWTADDPWRRLEAGAIIYLEFDRQRYDADGNWLAYVFLPSGRMLNADLVRVGLARPLTDGRNVRYLDLFHELAAGSMTPEPEVTEDE